MDTGLKEEDYVRLEHSKIWRLFQRFKDSKIMVAAELFAPPQEILQGLSHFCDLDNFPLIVVVADIHAHRIWGTSDFENDSVKVVVVENGNYADAKIVAKEIASKLEGWQLEGGAHNIARRDGIGSLILDAWNEIGRIPDHYFQGVGGGPGPIGVYEMMQRLIDFGHDEGTTCENSLITKSRTLSNSQSLARWKKYTTRF